MECSLGLMDRFMMDNGVNPKKVDRER